MRKASAKSCWPSASLLPAAAQTLSKPTASSGWPLSTSHLATRVAAERTSEMVWGIAQEVRNHRSLPRFRPRAASIRLPDRRYRQIGLSRATNGLQSEAFVATNAIGALERAGVHGGDRWARRRRRRSATRSAAHARPTLPGAEQPIARLTNEVAAPPPAAAVERAPAHLVVQTGAIPAKTA